MPLRYYISFLDLVPVFFLFISNLHNNSLGPVQIFGFILAIVGILLWTLSRIQLGTNFSLTARSSALITTGTYSYIRHPIYLFSSLALFGIMLIELSYFQFAILILAIIIQIYRVHHEENVLLKKFPIEYSKYKSHTWF